MESQESVRFEEGDKSEFQDVLETTTHSQELSDRFGQGKSNNATEPVGAGEFHGKYGSASLRECVERLEQQELTTSAALHSGAGVRTNPSQMTNPPQFCLRRVL